MVLPKLLTAVFSVSLTCVAAAAVATVVSEHEAKHEADAAAREFERALHLTPNPERGREVFLMCAVCHQPEGWGTPDGNYPQVAGQLYPVIIKQMADIRARNRDTPTMFPFTMLEFLDLQQIADVAAYLSELPMNPNNGVGPGTDLEKGERLYREYCVDCHGEQGEGIAHEHMPLIQGQHYPYLVRQFEWIASGKRRNADPEMVEQIEGFSSDDISAIMDYTPRMSPPPEKLAKPGWQNPDFAEFERAQAQPRVQSNAM
jgi:cytochrome c553